MDTGRIGKVHKNKKSPKQTKERGDFHQKWQISKYQNMIPAFISR